MCVFGADRGERWTDLTPVRAACWARADRITRATGGRKASVSTITFTDDGRDGHAGVNRFTGTFERLDDGVQVRTARHHPHGRDRSRPAAMKPGCWWRWPVPACSPSMARSWWSAVAPTRNRFRRIIDVAGDTVAVELFELSGWLVSYRERVALPPVRSPRSRSSAGRLAGPCAVDGDRQQVIETGAQVPIPFADRGVSALQENHRSTLSARITVDGRLAWTSDTHIPMGTRNPPPASTSAPPASPPTPHGAPKTQERCHGEIGGTGPTVSKCTVRRHQHVRGRRHPRYRRPPRMGRQPQLGQRPFVIGAALFLFAVELGRRQDLLCRQRLGRGAHLHPPPRRRPVGGHDGHLDRHRGPSRLWSDDGPAGPRRQGFNSLVVNTSPEPVLNVIVSLAEDGLGAAPMSWPSPRRPSLAITLVLAALSAIIVFAVARRARQMLTRRRQNRRP